jgi:Flp pilus assembly protein TadG
MRRRRKAPVEDGSATVEFALVLPLLFMVALALVQVALLGRDQLLVEAAARAGARAAARPPSTPRPPSSPPRGPAAVATP